MTPFIGLFLIEIVYWRLQRSDRMKTFYHPKSINWENILLMLEVKETFRLENSPYFRPKWFKWMLSFIQIQSYGFNHTFQCSSTSFLFKISGSHPIVETNPWNIDSIHQFGNLAPNGSKKIWSFFQNQSYGFSESSTGSRSTFLL